MYKKPFRKIPSDTLEKVQKKIDEAIEMIEPYAADLSGDERLDLSPAGEDALCFAELCLEFADENSDLFPSFMQPSNFRREFSFARQLRDFAGRIDCLKDSVSDVEALADDHVLRTAFAFYDTIKIAARHDIPGTEVIFDELKTRLPAKKNGKRRFYNHE